MTSLIAWIAIDQRAPSAFYMAADSRISWGSGNARWDAGRKLFICRQHPDLFGYVGDVVFPSSVLGQITEAADTGLLFQKNDNSETKHRKFISALTTSFNRRHNAPDVGFMILHGSRDFSGPKAQFRLWCQSFSARSKSWSELEVEVPTRQSSLLAAYGTGARSVITHTLEWNASDQGGTSRAIFSAFCDSIQSAADPFSGGVPQLIGMHHTRLPQIFGVVQDNQRYFQGFPLSQEIESGAIEWRDELFQRIDGQTLQILEGAQRHTRPPSR